MYCVNCGNEVENGTNFCGVCGTALTESSSNIVGNNSDSNTTGFGDLSTNNINETKNYHRLYVDEVAASALEWGILSIIFALNTGFLGIIFGCIGLVKANKFKSINNGVLTGKANTGRGLSIAGLCIGIVITIFFVFIFVVSFLIALSEASLQ